MRRGDGDLLGLGHNRVAAAAVNNNVMRNPKIRHKICK